MTGGLDRFIGHVSWSFVGVLLAMVAGAFAVYTSYFQEKRPELVYSVLSNASVLDVREQLAELQVIYKGIDIRKNDQTLTVMIVRVENQGSADILRQHFDTGSPAGLRIENAKIVQSEVLGASSDYLRNQLRLTRSPNGELAFAPIVLEAGESFTLKLLALHDRNTAVTPKPVGKIAGVKSTRVDVQLGDDKRSFHDQVFDGSLLVQLVRMPAYFAWFIFTFGLLVGGPSMLSQAWTKHRRSRAMKRLRRTLDVPLEPWQSQILKGYIDNGLAYAQDIQTFLHAPARVVRFPGGYLHLGDRVHALNNKAMKDLQRIGLVKVADGSVTVDESGAPGIRTFVERVLEVARNQS